MYGLIKCCTLKSAVFFWLFAGLQQAFIAWGALVPLHACVISVTSDMVSSYELIIMLCFANSDECISLLRYVLIFPIDGVYYRKRTAGIGKSDPVITVSGVYFSCESF